MKKQKHTCCICGRDFEGWGNNPAPAKEKGVCCDECNFNLVLPIRMLLLEWQKATETEKEKMRKALARKNDSAEVGDALVIIELKGEKTDEYMGRFGIITSIDDIGQLHGTWGGLAVIPQEDIYSISKFGDESEYEEEESRKEIFTA